jgi:hypothetical protein
VKHRKKEKKVIMKIVPTVIMVALLSARSVDAQVNSNRSLRRKMASRMGGLPSSQVQSRRQTVAITSNYIIKDTVGTGDPAGTGDPVGTGDPAGTDDPFATCSVTLEPPLAGILPGVDRPKLIVAQDIDYPP